MPRIMTMRGMRALDRTIALPRETQAAARTAQAVGAQMDKLAPSISAGVKQQVLTEGFADAMQAMAIKRDPYVSMFGIMTYLLDDSAAPGAASANFFYGQPAGAAASGVAGVWHNLLDDRQPLKPCLVHTVGISAIITSSVDCLDLRALATARVTLQRNKEDIFEIPLAHALGSLIILDASEAAAPIFDLEPLAGGGLEIEGHGAPFLMDEAIGLRVDWPQPADLGQQETGKTGSFILVGRVDGEVMDV